MIENEFDVINSSINLFSMSPDELKTGDYCEPIKVND